MRVSGCVVVAGALALALCGCGSSSKSAGSTGTSGGTGGTANCSAPAKAGTPIKVGLLYAATGPLGAENKFTIDGVNARFAYEKAQTGLDFVVDQGDTGSDPTRNLQQAQRMIANKDFAVMEDDVADSGSAAALHAAGMPVTGFALEPVWGTNNNMFGFSGAPAGATPYTEPAKTVEALGGTSLAIIAIGGNASSSAAANAAKAGFLATGGKSAIIDSVQFGQQQFTADVQKVKDANVDSIEFLTDTATGLSYYQAAIQAGLHFKVAIEDNGYAPATLTTYGAKVAGVYFSTAFAPVEVAASNPAVLTYINAMKQYSPGTDPSTQHAEYGWVMADMIIRGLKDANNCLSKSAFISGLSSDSTWNAGGLGPVVDFAKHAQSVDCEYLLQVNTGGTAFVPSFNGQPRCGVPTS